MEIIEAQRIFLQKIVNRTYSGTLETMDAFFEKGPVARKPTTTDIDLFEWYQKLTLDEKHLVQKICQKTAYSALFGTLVILDNLTGGYPANGEISDFALFLQIYDNKNDIAVDQPKEKLRINPSSSINDLHDSLGEFIPESPW